MRTAKPRQIDVLEGRMLLTGDIAALLAVRGFGDDAVADVAFDTGGAMYVAGHFRGAVRFGQGPAATRRSAGGTDAFVARYEPSGRLAWVRRFGAGGNDRAVSLCVDAAGGVVMTGAFEATADFDPSRRVAELVSRGMEDVFVVRLDRRGRLLWARSAGGPGRDLPAGVAADALGNAYVTGSFSRRADFDPSPGRYILHSVGGYDGFLMALDGDGKFIFAHSFGGPGHDIPADIAADSFGNTVLAGTFTGEMLLAMLGRTIRLASAGGTDVFAARFGFDGRIIDAMSAGGVLNDRAGAVALDGRAIYIAGSFAGQVDFQPGAGNTVLTSTGASADAFVARYAGSWSLDYARVIGGPGADVATALAVDAAGAVYVAGHWRGTADFDPGGGVFNMTAAGTEDAFVVKLAASGRFAYARSFGGTGRTSPSSVAVYRQTDVAVAGRFAGATDFDPGDGRRPARSAGANDGFVARLSQRLPSFSFARTVGTSGSRTMNSLAADEGDFLHVAGSFTGTLSFAAGAGSVDFTSAGGSDVFIGRFCNKCNITWGRSIGGAGDDVGVAVALGEDGSIIVAGTFTGTADFDPGPGVHQLTARGSDVFVMKLDARGSFVWARQMGGDGNDRPAALAVRGGRIYAAGSFEGAADFDPGDGVHTLTSAGGSDMFVMSLDADGDLAWAHRIGGGGDDIASALAVDASGNLFIAGTFSGQADFDPGPGLIPLVAGASPQVYVLKMTGAGEAVWARTFGGIYTGGAADIAACGDGGVVVTGGFAGQMAAGTQNLAGAGGSAAWVAKLSAAGNVLWARALAGDGEAAGAALAADRAGNVILAGHYTGTPADALPASAGGSDVFILRLDAYGSTVWAGRAGGPGDERATDALVAGSDAFVYVMGSFTAAGDFDPTEGVAELAPAGGTGTFITRIVF